MPDASAPSRRLLLRMRAAAATAVSGLATIVARGHRRRSQREVTRKGVGDFVTAMDLRAERRLRRALLAALPAAGFLGEETAPRDLERDYVWVVDPIDGTSNYANGLPHFAIAVALLFRRRPVVASIWCAPEGVLYEAVAGLGAFRAGRRLRMPPARWSDRTIIGCQWHRGQQDLRFLARLQRDGARVRTFGCTVAQLADVACGRLDANVQQQGRVWDLAAPGLLVEAAGGRLTDWSGRPLFPFASLTQDHSPSIAAGPAVLRRIVQRLRGQLVVSRQ